jgi:hypothetical protein
MTVSPDEAIDRLWRSIDNDFRPDLMVVEEYRIRPNEGNEWSTAPTIEVIGALRHKCRQYDIPFDTQSSRIMIPTAARMRRLGVALRDGTAHSDAAQLHGWHRILKPLGGLAHGPH